MRQFPEIVGVGIAILLMAAVTAGSLIIYEPTREPEQQVQVKIVDVYRDGLALRKVVTLVELEDGSRLRFPGKLGTVGETVSVYPSHVSLQR